jgi:hypothetical protein
MSNVDKLVDLMGKCETYEIILSLREEIKRRFKTEWKDQYFQFTPLVFDDALVYMAIYQVIGDMY